jgi:glycosyltransferase involved in cell wall biosynthesis
MLNDKIIPLTFGYYNGSTNICRLIIKAVIQKKFKKKWIKVLEREKPEVVILNSMVQWPMISLLNRLNIKSICFVRETMKGEKNKIINRIIASHLEKASGIAFLSCYDKNQWSLKGNIIQSVIPDLVDIELFRMNLNKIKARSVLKLETDIFYVLYVGGMSELKGAKTIVKAMKNCKEKKIKLLFLGNLGENIVRSKGISKLKNKMRILFVQETVEYIRQNKLDTVIEFIGMQRNMNYWYAACDVVVFPAKEAHQARPIYEAGVFSKPAIVPDFCNYYEYFQHEINGLVFKSNDSNELSEAIIRLYNNPNLGIRLGIENYK